MEEQPENLDWILDDCNQARDQTETARVVELAESWFEFESARGRRE
jgi:hypothetical protein